jgi:DNA-binding transcriptional LysR family regulator
MTPGDARSRNCGSDMTAMTNIPTELLRTLVAVVDLRSFTKAAHSLGVTQPAVSAQIKRLQMLLGSELLDKSAPGVCLTAKGETVVNEARRMLSINDRLVQLAGPEPATRTLRVGMPGDFVGRLLWRPLDLFRRRWPDVHLHVRAGPSAPLNNDLQHADLDLIVAISGTKPLDNSRFHWLEEMVWVRAPLTRLDFSAPIPLISHGRDCITHQHVTSCLEEAGFAYDLVFTGSSFVSLTSAVGAGFGIMAVPRSLFTTGDLVIWEDGPLPRVPPIVCSVRVRPDAGESLAQLAGAFADALLPAPSHAGAEHDVGRSMGGGGLEETMGITFNRDN